MVSVLLQKIKFVTTLRLLTVARCLGSEGANGLKVEKFGQKLRRGKKSPKIN